MTMQGLLDISRSTTTPSQVEIIVPAVIVVVIPAVLMAIASESITIKLAFAKSPCWT